jgi:hypothetical protein
MRMLESKGPLADISASGALDLTFASRTSGPVGSECQIRSTSWRFVPDNAFRKTVCPGFARATTAPIRAPRFRASSEVRAQYCGRREPSARAPGWPPISPPKLGWETFRCARKRGGIICKKAAIMGATTRRLPRRPHRRRHRKCPARKGLNVGRIVCPTQLKSYSRLHSSSRRRLGCLCRSGHCRRRLPVARI